MIDDTIRQVSSQLGRYKRIDSLLHHLDDIAEVTVVDEEYSARVEIQVVSEEIEQKMVELAEEAPGADKIEYSHKGEHYILHTSFRSDP